mgnify:FL=1
MVCVRLILLFVHVYDIELYFLFQWGGLMLILLLANFIYVKLQKHRQSYYPKEHFSDETDPLLLSSSEPSQSRDLDNSLAVSRGLDGSLRELKL